MTANQKVNPFEYFECTYFSGCNMRLCKKYKVILQYMKCEYLAENLNFAATAKFGDKITADENVIKFQLHNKVKFFCRLLRVNTLNAEIISVFLVRMARK